MYLNQTTYYNRSNAEPDMRMKLFSIKLGRDWQKFKTMPLFKLFFFLFVLENTVIFTKIFYYVMDLLFLNELINIKKNFQF